MIKKYEIPEQEPQPQMVNEPVVAYAVQQPHSDMCYNMHEFEAEDKSEKLQIPNTYEEALSIGAMDLEEARKELHAFVDKLAIEYDLQ